VPANARARGHHDPGVDIQRLEQRALNDLAGARERQSVAEINLDGSSRRQRGPGMRILRGGDRRHRHQDRQQ